MGSPAKAVLPWLWAFATSLLLAGTVGGHLFAQEPVPAPRPLPRPALPAAPGAEADQPAYPINLATALSLAHARPIDVALATQRVQAAQAQLDRAHTLWLPTIYLGADYARQDGQIQDVSGNVFPTSKSSFMAGAGPSAVFALTDAIYAPLAARQVVKSREADQQAAVNNTVLAVAENYFNVQQARGELAGALDTQRRTEELVRRAEGLAQGLIPALEVARARTELARRRQGVQVAVGQWEFASAGLARLLRLPPASLFVPFEVPHLRTHLVDLAIPLDDLIAVGLTMRPELTSKQALVQATLSRLHQEKIRPLIPSVLLRGNATNPTGTLSGGVFGGGLNGDLSNFNLRNSIDLQVVWEFQNLGFGNLAAVRERKAENQQAVLEVFRTQDTIAAEVVQAHSQARRALNRFQLAEQALAYAVQTADQSLEGLKQTRRVGEVLQLVVRPQEVVAAFQTLEQSYRDFYGAVADYNRAQFRLYRALGHPAQLLTPAESGAEMGTPAK